MDREFDTTSLIVTQTLVHRIMNSVEKLSA